MANNQPNSDIYTYSHVYSYGENLYQANIENKTCYTGICLMQTKSKTESSIRTFFWFFYRVHTALKTA